ncbi:MAG: hypothetical protein R3C59_02635 [Planctomycetaceae bacterium]
MSARSLRNLTESDPDGFLRAGPWVLLTALLLTVFATCSVGRIAASELGRTSSGQAVIPVSLMVDAELTDHHSGSSATTELTFTTSAFFPIASLHPSAAPVLMCCRSEFRMRFHQPADATVRTLYRRTARAWGPHATPISDSPNLLALGVLLRT